ncbi:MAG: NADPH:quinone oxidoreductase family protein, partial [Rubrobacter sp.]|nr:NADPH:quinone oxidoreductase family protein [Rubrobacter sp.]
APLLPKGGFTEKVAVPASGVVFRVPDTMSFEVAAAINLVYQTAFFGLLAGES